MRAKLLFLVLLITSITAGDIFSSETGIVYSKSDKLKHAFEELVTYPEKAIQEKLDGIVMVDFTITASGNAQINAINYSHYEFKEQVIKKLNKINRKADPELIGKTFIYKFVFIQK